MTIVERVKRSLASRRARKHADYLVLGYLDELATENVRMRAEISGVTRKGFSVGGRYVLGRTIAGVLIVVVLGAGVVWWANSSGAEAFREGMREGGVAARSRN